MKGLFKHPSRPTIGFLINQLDGRYQPPIWYGVADACEKADANCVIFAGKALASPYIDEWRHNLVYELVNPSRLDGLVIASGNLANFVGHEAFSRFIKPLSGIPIVSIGLSLEGIPSVLLDNYTSAKEAVIHLIRDHKYRRIACIRGPKTNDEANERFKAYLDAMTENNLTIRDGWIYEGDFSSESAANGMEKILKACPDIDAVVCANDDSATGALTAVREAGKRVPEDIALIGFDNIEEVRYQNPSLTTVSQPFYEQGFKATEILFSMIRGEHPPYQTILKAPLIRRASCGCIEQENTHKTPGTSSADATRKLRDLIRETPRENLEDSIFRWFESTIQHETKRRFLLQDSVWNLRGFLGSPVHNLTPEKLLKRLNEVLSGLSIPGCYVSLFPGELTLGDQLEKLPETSLLAMVSNDQGAFFWTRGEFPFTTRHILPDTVLPYQRRYTMLIQPLFILDRYFGFLFCEMGPRLETVYGILREQLSDMLLTIRLFQENEAAEQKLRGAMLELQQSEERFKETALFLPAIVFETDLNFQVSFMNQAAQDAFGPELDNSGSPRLLEKIHPEDRERFKDLCRQALSGGLSGYFEFRLLPSAGGTATLFARANPIRHNGLAQGLRFSAIDLKFFIDSAVSPQENALDAFPLSPREREVLSLMLEGYRTREIATRLFLSENTVKVHTHSIYEKTGVNNKQSLFQLLKEQNITRFGRESFIFSMLGQLARERDNSGNSPE